MVQHLGHIRENSLAMAGERRRDPVYEQGVRALGTRLRQLRGELGLVALAARVLSSKSALSRYERGDKLLPPDLADRLDAYYKTGGDIRDARDALEAGRNTSGLVGQYRGSWLHHFPNTYVGAVWTQLTPHPRRQSSPHELTIRWGPWTRRVELPTVDPAGIFLSYTKGDDGLSVPLFFDVRPAARLDHGLGMIEGATDINRGWRHEDD